MLHRGENSILENSVLAASRLNSYAGRKPSVDKEKLWCDYYDILKTVLETSW